MSTEFRTETDEWVMTRWGRSPGVGVDFGSSSRFDRVVSFCMTSPDVEFFGDDGSTVTGGDVVRMVFEGVFPVSPTSTCPGTPTFGEFVGTVEVGSGEMFDRMGVEPEEV
jgi:hypothetical protein